MPGSFPDEEKRGLGVGDAVRRCVDECCRILSRLPSMWGGSLYGWLVLVKEAVRH